MSDLNLKIIKDYVDKKVAGALTGKSAYEIAVEQGYDGTEEEWLSEMKDYEGLENKPQINNVTLSGNKSSDDLGLQKKLAAGTNITIENDGTISASGGVTSYNDLTDKPFIEYYTGSSSYATASFTGTLSAGVSGPIIISKIGTAPNNQFYIGLDSEQVFLVKTATSYDINTTRHSPFFLALSANRLSHLPSFVSPKSGTEVSLLNLSGKNIGEQIQLLFWQDSNNGSHYAFRVFGTAWQEIGGGYTLTEQDKQDIADIVLSELPTTQGVLYGNTSN